MMLHTALQLTVSFELSSCSARNGSASKVCARVGEGGGGSYPVRLARE